MLSRSQTTLAAVSLAVLLGCSAPEDDEPAGAPAAAPPQERSASTKRQEAAPGPRGDCDLLSVEDIQQAFGGALTVKRVSGHGLRGSSCTVSLVEGEDGQLVFQAGNREAFDARKQAYQSQSQLSFEPVDVGIEGYLVNQAQVIAVDANGRSISIGLVLFVFGGGMPIDPDGVSTGLQSLARTALSRY
jgi:hypothetical protein